MIYSINKWVKDKAQTAVSTNSCWGGDWTINVNDTQTERERGLPRAFQHPQQRRIPPGRAAKHRASSESPRVTTATPVHNWVYRQQHAAGWRRFLSRLRPRVTHQPHSSSYALTGRRVLGQQRACTSRLEIPRLSRLLTQSRRNAPKMEPC